MNTYVLQVKAIFGLYGCNIRLSLDAEGKHGKLFLFLKSVSKTFQGKQRH